MRNRIYAIFLRQLYLYRHSVHRFVVLFFWPPMELILWGLITVYLNRLSMANFNFIPLFLGAVIFWNFYIRIEQSISVSFLEDVWTRNVGNVFASPIRPVEFIFGLMLFSVVQAFLSFAILLILAQLFWNFSVFQFGWLLAPFFLNLFLFGWTLGIIATAILLRLGPSAEMVAWAMPAVIQPFAAVFYPVAVLPMFLQRVAWFVPLSHIFEGLRAVVLFQGFNAPSLFLAFGLNVLYFIIAILIFHLAFRSVRKKE